MGNQPTVKQIEKWCAALRSGKYKQTRWRLQKYSGYCCLGVACDIFSKNHERDADGYLKGYMPGTASKDPAWLAMASKNFRNITGYSLQDLNDNTSMGPQLNLNFNEIADLLEAVYIHKVLGPL